MNKRDLAYKLYEAGVIAFDDYQCVDCGGSNVLVDSFYACAVEIEVASGRDGFVAGYFHYKNYGFQFEEELEAASSQYADSIRRESK